MPTVCPYVKYLQTPLGLAQCDLIWIPDSESGGESQYHCWQDESNEAWWWGQRFVRLTKSLTDDLVDGTEIAISNELIKSHYKQFLRHKKSPFHELAKKLAPKT